MIQDHRLCERVFGSMEMKSNDHYEEIWSLDQQDTGSSTVFGQETTEQVVERVRSLLNDLVEKFASSVLVLVAHGDVLQIASTLWHQIPSYMHRSVPHLQNCELRVLGEYPFLEHANVVKAQSN